MCDTRCGADECFRVAHHAIAVKGLIDARAKDLQLAGAIAEQRTMQLCRYFALQVTPHLLTLLHVMMSRPRCGFWPTSMRSSLSQ